MILIKFAKRDGSEGRIFYKKDMAQLIEAIKDADHRDYSGQISEITFNECLAAGMQAVEHRKLSERTPEDKLKPSKDLFDKDVAKWFSGI